ncbi:MAG: sialate O-acetylesterase [bacterium]|nr:sialate O-acetylesterase [bacterium]
MTSKLVSLFVLGVLACAADSGGMHLYLLIGQSNMAGRGKVANEDRQPRPRVFALDEQGKWAPAVDPIHFDKPIAGVGLGRTFGIEMAKRNPDARIGLIPCARGGTSILAWQKDAEPHPRFGPMYADTVRRVRAALNDGELKGILWHQGESDTKRAGDYEELVPRFFGDLRRDLEAVDVPLVVGLLGNWRENDPKQREGAIRINAVFRNLPQRIQSAAWVDSAGLTNKPDDPSHFNAASYRELGRRYAAAMEKLQ